MGFAGAPESNDAQAKSRLAEAAPAPIAPKRRVLMWAIGGVSIVGVIVLAVFLLLRPWDRETGGQAGSGGAVALATETATQAALAVAVVPTPTDTATPSVSPLPPTPTPAPTSTLTPTPTATSTVPPSLTPNPTARVITKPSATPSRKASATPAMLAAPILKSPNDPATTSGMTTFVWEWTGPALTANQGFEIRVWKEGQPDHDGAAGIVSGTARQVEIDLTGSYGFQQGGNGRYFWTVAVAQREPYRRIGSEASPRTIEISVTGEAVPTSPKLP